MSASKDKHKVILGFLMDKEATKKADIVNQFQHWYHTNSAFHIGNLLHTMCKQKQIHSPKHGYYKYGASPLVAQPIGNEINLFSIA